MNTTENTNNIIDNQALLTVVILTRVSPSFKDVGHPHIFDAPDELLEFFKDFDPIIKKMLKREEGYQPLWYHGTLIYAGKKSGSRMV